MKHTLTEILSTLTASLPAGRTPHHSQRLPLVLAMLVLTFALGSANAQTPSVLHVFDTEDPCDTKVLVDAGTPVYSGILAQGLDGSIYSSTAAGGACGYGYGAAYQITITGKVTPLHSFGFVGNEGVQADGGLTLATDGNFYGTTKAGGTHNVGTIFMITPGGALTYLHQFNGTDGAYPTAPPIQGLDGYFYGTTSQGGTGAPGVVYKMQPKSPWTLTSYPLTNFGYPAAPLVQATDGYFYGTAVGGGTHGSGVVFRMTSSGNVTVIYNFDNTNGSQPIAPLIQGSDGNLYGTTSIGGDANGDGVVFKLTKSGVITILHQFNGLDGSKPLGGLVQASNGSFYGVASLGGINQQGTLYKLTLQGNTWSFFGLHNFDLWGTGEQPQLTLLQHTNGTLYGDSWFGGTTIEESGGKSQGQGTFYRISDASLKPFISLIPAGAKVGTSVTVLGQGLASTTNVSFNGASARFTTNKAGTYLTAIVPSAAKTGVVSVTTSSGVFKSLKPFIVIPFITSFSPTSGKVGDQVVIMGGGFYSNLSQVTFGGVKAIFSVNSGSQLSATVPTGAKTGKISIKTDGGIATSSATFTVVP